MAFVQRGYSTATELAAAAFSNRTNVLLARFSQAETFDHAWNFNRKNSLLSDGRAQLNVGGLRRSLYVDVATQVQRWLTDCDARMMSAAQDTAADESCDEQVVLELIVSSSHCCLFLDGGQQRVPAVHQRGAHSAGL